MTAWDPYLDLQSGVLRNRLGITDPAELARAEADFTALRLAQLSTSPEPGDFDLPHIQAVHRRLFSDVYDWAGELRTVHLGKGGDRFCPPEELHAQANRVFLLLAARDHLRWLGRADCLDALAELGAGLTWWHGFREGNGRTTRAFLAALAETAGYRLDWATMDAEENRVASRACHGGDLKPLRAQLDRLLATR